MGAADDGEYRQKPRDAAEIQKDKGFGKRSRYERLERFNSQRELTAWWDRRRAKGETWRLNTRYDARRGATEYWHCAVSKNRLQGCRGYKKSSGTGFGLENFLFGFRAAILIDSTSSKQVKKIFPF